MKKTKILCVVMALFSSVLLFSQTAPCTELTDADVSAFVKNGTKIIAELEKLNVGFGDNSDVDDIKALNNVAKADALFAKYGISGPDRALKIAAIATNYAYLKADAELKKDPVTYALIMSMDTDPLSQVKEQTNEQDLKVVKSQYSALDRTFEAIDEMDD